MVVEVERLQVEPLDAHGGPQRIVQHLDYFQHPLLVVMLLVAGASITFSLEALAVVVIVTALHAVGRPIADPFPVSAGAAAIAVALDVFRGALR